MQSTWISLPQSLCNNRIIPTSQTRRELQTHSRIVNLIHLYWHNLLQLANTLLYLYGLCGLIAETLNERPCFCNFLLLVLIRTELLFTTLFPEDEILVILYTIILHVSTSNLQRTVRYIVDERTVVTHKDNGLSTLREELLKPLNRLNVKVVRRLIQQEYIRTTEKNLRQLNTHTPSTRELTCRAVEVITRKTETRQRALNFSLIVLASHHHISVVLSRKAFH